MALSRLCCRTSSLLPKSPALLPGHYWSPSSSLSQLRHAHDLQGYSVSAAAPCHLLISLRQLARELPSRGFSAAAAATGSTSPATAAAASSEQEKTGEMISTTTSTDSDKRSGLRRRRNRGRRDLVPFGGGGLGNALWEATESVNRLLRNLSSPWQQLFRRVREEDDKAYKLQLEVPGMSKEDLRVTVQGNYLVVTGEKKEEEEYYKDHEQEGRSDGEDHHHWPAAASRSYDYCNTWCMLPEDAKVEEIKAEVKNGMLYVTIPRTEEKKTDVLEVEVH